MERTKGPINRSMLFDFKDATYFNICYEISQIPTHTPQMSANDNIVVIFDYFSKWSKLKVLQNFEKSSNMAKKIKEKPCLTCLKLIFHLIPGTRIPVPSLLCIFEYCEPLR